MPFGKHRRRGLLALGLQTATLYYAAKVKTRLSKEPFVYLQNFGARMFDWQVNGQT